MVFFLKKKKHGISRWNNLGSTVLTIASLWVMDWNVLVSLEVKLRICVQASWRTYPTSWSHDVPHLSRLLQQTGSEFLGSILPCQWLESHYWNYNLKIRDNVARRRWNSRKTRGANDSKDQATSLAWFGCIIPLWPRGEKTQNIKPNDPCQVESPLEFLGFLRQNE